MVAGFRLSAGLVRIVLGVCSASTLMAQAEPGTRADVTKSAAPPSAVAVVRTPAGVQVSWQAAAGAAQYVVMRAANATAAGVPVGMVPAGTLTFLDRGFGSPAVYQVVAVAADGRRGTSTSVAFPPPSAAGGVGATVASSGTVGPGTAKVTPTGADVSVTLSVPASVKAGETFTTSLRVMNAGPEAATGTITRWSLPKGSQPGPLTSPDATCRTEVPPDGWFVFVCDHGVLMAFTSHTVTMTSVSIPTAGSAVFAGSVATTSADRTASNNTATATVSVTRPTGDLRTQIRVDSAAPHVNGRVMYTLLVFNEGPDAIPSATLTDTLPVGLTLSSVAPLVNSVNCGSNYCGGAGYDCRWSTLPNGRGVATCTTPLIGYHATAGATVYARVTTTGRFTNGFSTSGASFVDGNASNNSASVSIDVATAKSQAIDEKAPLTVKKPE